MKKLILLFFAIAASVSVKAQLSEQALLKKAKANGITATEYSFFVQREKARAGHKEALPGSRGVYGRLTGNNNASLRTATASLCGNLDFGDTNFNNWGVFIGTNVNSGAAPTGVTIDPNPNVCCNNAVLDSINSVVPNSTISVLSNYAEKHIARVNHIGAGAQLGILEKQIAVNVNQAYLNFSYAAFLENAGHTYTDQPYVQIMVFDSSNVAIPGASLIIVATTGSPNPGFSPVTFTNGTNYFYKPWTPVTINLSAYAGQVVTLQVIASDCVAGGHGGHAYVDFDCGGPTAGVPNVWPGDANYDLNVDFLDLFYVGAGFGATGTARSVQGNSWAAKPSNNWNLNSLYLVDAKHADCDGNGIVGLSDTTAIYQNYGQAHVFRSSRVELTAQSTAAPKMVSMQVSTDSVYAGQPFTIDFKIGTPSDLVDNIYAIGFSMNYPDQLLDNSASVMNCNASVVSNGSGFLNLFKPASGMADLAITKVNQVNTTNVAGTLFSLNLKAGPVIGNDANFNFALSNMKAITKSGLEIPLSGLNAGIKFKTSDATGLASYTADQFSMYPNPAQTKITVNAPAGSRISSYTIYSVSGALMKSGEAAGSKSLDVPVSDLANGCYFIELKTGNGSLITKRFIKS